MLIENTYQPKRYGITIKLHLKINRYKFLNSL